MQKKLKLGMMLVLLGLLLFGCGKADSGEMAKEGKEALTAEDVVTLKKDGSIVEEVRRSYQKEYYEEESLKEMILSEASAYNQKAGENRIAVKKVSLKDGEGRVTLNFGSAGDFAAFNVQLFYAGTVAEAYEEGLDLDIVLTNVADEAETIGRDELLEMGSRKLVIVESEEGEPITVNTYGKVLYVGGNAVVDGRKSVRAEGDGLSYIVFK